MTDDTIRVLPSFADLMLLPKAYDATCSVAVENDGAITVNSANQAQMAQHFEGLPHVQPEVGADGVLRLRAKPGKYQHLLLVWPDGEQRGVLQWQHGYFSEVSGTTMVELIAAGLHVDLIHCRPQDDIETVLTQRPHLT